MFEKHANFMKVIFIRYKTNSSAKFILGCFTVPAINEQPQIYFIMPDYIMGQEFKMWFEATIQMYLQIPYEADYFVLKITKIGDMHIFEVMFIIWRCCNYEL